LAVDLHLVARFGLDIGLVLDEVLVELGRGRSFLDGDGGEDEPVADEAFGVGGILRGRGEEEQGGEDGFHGFSFWLEVLGILTFWTGSATETGIFIFSKNMYGF